MFTFVGASRGHLCNSTVSCYIYGLMGDGEDYNVAAADDDDNDAELMDVQKTFQTFIDDLFRSILTVDESLPAAIKYLFDFFDSAAERHGVNDANVVHTWKTNRYIHTSMQGQF